MPGTRLGQQQVSTTLQNLEDQVSALTDSGPAFSDPITKFTLADGPASGSVQITFRAATLEGISAINLFRGLTRDFGSATQLTQFTASSLKAGADTTYTDTSTALVGKTVWYTLQIVPSNAANQTIEHGPQSI